jgi:S1-C subfamily serine protease
MVEKASYIHRRCSAIAWARRAVPETTYVVLLVLGLAPISPALAEFRYIWTDKNGSEHVTRDKPSMNISYELITVPDDLAWRNPPNMAGELAIDKTWSTQDLFKQLAPSVYWLESRYTTFGTPPETTYGSAVAITDELALTNCHVVGSDKKTLRLGGGKSELATDVELVAANFDADRCVIRVKGLVLQPIRGIRAVSALAVGETLYAIGNPRGLQRTISQGLLSGIRDEEEVRLLQTTAPISPGSSGGGLFDGRGNLIGITSLTLVDSQNLNFAVPAEDFWK